jgi:hypothetical protein
MNHTKNYLSVISDPDSWHASRGTSCVTTPNKGRMAHADEWLERTTMLLFGSLDFVFDGPVESPAGAVFSWSQPDVPVPPQDQPHEEP